jgi:hypothetical protein
VNRTLDLLVALEFSINEDVVAAPCFTVTIVAGVPKELEWAFDIREAKNVSSSGLYSGTLYYHFGEEFGWRY